MIAEHRRESSAGTTAAGPPAPDLTLGGAYRFFLPLVLMTELNAISKSVIHAFLARTAFPSVTLAAFNVSFTFYYSISSVTEVSTLVSLGYLRDRRSLRRLAGFFCLLAAPPVALAQVVAFTAAGDWVYGTLFGASPAAVGQAKLATFVFSLSAPILIVRALAFALLMLEHRTVLITASTLVRLLSLGGSLLVLPLLVQGAAAGAAALVLCMLAETLVAGAVAARYARGLPAGPGPAPAFRELWRFAWPLALNQSSEMGMVFVINVFLGRLVHPDLALAAFGVVHGLVGLLYSPVRNLAHAAQTLARTAADRRVLTRFAGHLVAVFAALTLVLFFTPLAHVILARVMGLSPALEAACAPAMQLAVLMVGFWTFSALFRGLMASLRSTTLLAATGLARFAAAGLVSAIALAASGLNGAVLGLAAWIAGYAVEVLILGRRLGGTTRAPSDPSRARKEGPA